MNNNLPRPSVGRILIDRLRSFLGHAINVVIPLSVLLIVGGTLSWVAYNVYRQKQEFEFQLLETHVRNADAQVPKRWGAEMESVVPWVRLIAVIESYYPTTYPSIKRATNQR